MNTSQFRKINSFAHTVQKQSNTRHLSWMQQFGSRLQSEITTAMGAGVPPLLASAITQFLAAAAHEDDCYLIISKSDLTPQIAGADSERDTKYVGLKTMADALSRIGSDEQKQAALQMLDLCAHYKVDISERYDDETTKMTQLLQELQSSAWTARVELLGLTATVSELVALNQQIKHLIELRNNDLAQVTPQAMLQARQASDEAYALAVTVINALAVTTWTGGSSPYDQAIARINQDQDYYVKNVFAQGKTSGNTTSSDPGTSTDPEQGGDTGGGTSTDPDPEQGGDNGGGTTPDPDPGQGGDNGGGSGGDDNGGDDGGLSEG